MTLKVMEIFKSCEPELDTDYIVIDNNSSKPITKTDLQNFKNIKLIQNDQNLGFAKAVNQGIRKAKGNYILLLNSDLFVKPSVISKLIKYLRDNKKVGIVGPKMVYPNGKAQVSFGKFPNFWREFLRTVKLGQILPGATLTYENFFNKKYYKKINIVDWVSGGCMLMKKKAVEDIGLFDENYFFGIEDIDYGFRARQKNWQVIFYPSLSVVHNHGGSVGGKRSLFRLQQEKFGINYFLKKFKMGNVLGRFLVQILYMSKINILKILRLV